MPRRRIKNHDLVRDKITGFEGVVTAVCEYAHGCVWVEVTPEGLHNGSPITPPWFDEPRLVKRRVRKKSPAKKKRKKYGPPVGPPVRQIGPPGRKVAD